MLRPDPNLKQYTFCFSLGSLLWVSGHLQVRAKGGCSDFGVATLIRTFGLSLGLCHLNPALSCQWLCLAVAAMVFVDAAWYDVAVSCLLEELPMSKCRQSRFSIVLLFFEKRGLGVWPESCFS